ncbi:hypothetical protein [Streptomyces sp. HC307]|uniref:hypothetical protein n=1 Tax=Streptomyces flavusporus TaxID=3385496 RepID=UPI003917387C
MPKTWQPSDAKRFAREVKLNKPYYIVYNMATNLAPYEDSKTYSEIVFTDRLPFTGNPCTRGGTSAVGICQRFGPVYDTPPRGMRNIAGPAPQVAGPVPEGYEAYLDEAEIRGLEKQVRDGSNPRIRRPLGGWRV